MNSIRLEILYHGEYIPVYINPSTISYWYDNEEGYTTIVLTNGNTLIARQNMVDILTTIFNSENWG